MFSVSFVLFVHKKVTQKGKASPRPFVVSVVHTMNTMAGAMQFSRG